MSALSHEERQKLMAQAMEEMEKDPRGFVRFFVHRNEEGDGTPRHPRP